MRRRLPSLVLLAAAVFAAACNDSTGPRDQPSAQAAALKLTQLADSLAAHGGEPSEIVAFRGLANLVSATGRISAVTISVDGAPSEFLATAEQIQIGCPVGMLCTMEGVPPLRMMMAWQRSDPRRFVQLTTTDWPAATFAAGTETGVAGTGVLYYDGVGQLFAGHSDGQTMTSTASDTPCPTNDLRMPAVYAPLNCVQVESQVAFDATVSLSPFAQRDDVTAAPHTLAMGRQTVLGVALLVPPFECAACSDSIPPLPGVFPPVRPPADSLRSSLAVTVGSDVAFTFTVTNASSAAADVTFPSAQQYDVRVWDGTGHTLLWRWAADKAFAQVVTTRTLAAGESVTYVEHWAKPASGSYRALANFTSSSHGAAAYADFQVP